MTLTEALRDIRSRIDAACERAGRDPTGVTLVAVTKGVPVETIRRAREQGIEHFGENYANELSHKAPAVPATWHFLGKLQRGTASRVAGHAHVIHSAERSTGLRHVGRRAAEEGREVRCLAQVDFTGRRQGVRPDEVDALMKEASEMDGIRMVGLMTIPPWTEDADDARPFFARLRALRGRLRKQWPDLIELSMGMSSDFHVAVEEGATMVRVGTALFGSRPGSVAGGAAGRGDL